MLQVLITHHVRCALLLTAFLATVAPASVTAQASAMIAPLPQTGTDGLYPGPVRTRDLHRALDAAGASADQQLAAADALEAHHQAYHDLRDRVLLPSFLDYTFLTWNLMSRTLPPRHAWPELQGRIRSARAQLQAIDDALFNNLKALFSEEQHAPLTALAHQRLRESLIIEMQSIPPGHHFLNPDFERAVADAAPKDALRLRAEVSAALHRYLAESLAALSRRRHAHPPSHIEAMIIRADELELLIDQPRHLDEMEFQPLRDAMREAAAEIMNERRSGLRDLNVLILTAAESIASHLHSDAASRFMNHVHEIRHPQFGSSVFAINFVDRLIDQEGESAAHSEDATGDVLQLLLRARDRLAPLTEQAVHAADEMTGLSGPVHQPGSDEISRLQQRFYGELRPEIGAIMIELREAYEATAGRPLFSQGTPGPDSRAEDDPFAAALGAERMSDLPSGAARSLDWALPPPIRTIHATRWARLLGLSADEALQLHAMITEHRAFAVDQPAHQHLRSFARRMVHLWGPSDQPTNNPVTTGDLPDLSRARRAAITSMIDMDAAFFGDLRMWLNDDDRADIVRLLKADRQRELFTTRELIVTDRRRSPSLLWRTSPVMLLGRLDGVSLDALQESLRAADHHIMDIATHAKRYFDHRVVVAQVDDEGFLETPFGEEIDREMVHQRLAGTLRQKYAARRAVRDAIGSAFGSMIAALTDLEAMELTNQLRLQAYPFLFESMTDIMPNLLFALQATDRSDPRHDALTDLIMSWRTESDRLNEMMIALIEESDDEATTLVQPTDDRAARLDDFGRRMTIVFLQLMRSECDARTLLRHDAIMAR